MPLALPPIANNVVLRVPPLIVVVPPYVLRVVVVKVPPLVFKRLPEAPLITAVWAVTLPPVATSKSKVELVPSVKPPDNVRAAVPLVVCNSALVLELLIVNALLDESALASESERIPLPLSVKPPVLARLAS